MGAGLCFSDPAVGAGTAAGDAGKLPGGQPLLAVMDHQFGMLLAADEEAGKVRPTVGLAGVVPAQIHAPADRVRAIGLAAVGGAAVDGDQAAALDGDGDRIPGRQFFGRDGEAAALVGGRAHVPAQRLLVAAGIDH